MASNGFTFSSFLLRLFVALVLVFASYNPSGYSYSHWAREMDLSAIDPLIVLAGVVLLIGWVIFLRATIRSLGLIGILLATALFGTIVWTFIYYDLLVTDNKQVMTYVIEALLAMILAAGMSWSHVRRRMSGQIDVDDVDAAT